MLVLTRKLGEEIVLPGLDITIKLVEVHGHRIRLGICAPPSIEILRREVADAVRPPSEERTPCNRKVHDKEPSDAVSKGAFGRPAFSVSK